MGDATRSLWSRLMENSSGNLSSKEPAKHSCPYDRKSCKKAQGGIAKGPGHECHSGCPEPKRPLQPEEFCPDNGRKIQLPPPCCFIRKQDPCAPCCCSPAPDKCEDECHPVPKRAPICGCDLCKKKECPDGKCCSPTEPSCLKVLRRCKSESQTSAEYSRLLETKDPDIDRYRRRNQKKDVSLFELIKRPLDWLLCTPLKIPIPHIEWCPIKGPKLEDDRCNSTPSPLSPGEYRYFQENPNCNCGPCRIRRVFEQSSVERRSAANGDTRSENAHPDACDCRLCRIRRVLEKPLC